MGFLDRLFGTDEAAAPAASRSATTAAAPTDDERALERYRYLLRTAPPETIEEVHREAFGKLTDEQRAVIYEELSRGAGTGERPLSSEPATLARAATRAESRKPGTLEQGLGGALLGTVAGYVIGSSLVSAFLPWDANSTDAAATATADAGTAGSADASDMTGSDMTGTDISGFGGGFDGDFGGDFF